MIFLVVLSALMAFLSSNSLLTYVFLLAFVALVLRGLFFCR